MSYLSEVMSGIKHFNARVLRVGGIPKTVTWEQVREEILSEIDKEELANLVEQSPKTSGEVASSSGQINLIGTQASTDTLYQRPIGAGIIRDISASSSTVSGEA